MSSLHIVDGKRGSNGLRQSVEIAKEEEDTWEGRLLMAWGGLTHCHSLSESGHHHKILFENVFQLPIGYLTLASVVPSEGSRQLYLNRVNTSHVFVNREVV
jgi:hypothetical protein